MQQHAHAITCTGRGNVHDVCTNVHTNQHAPDTGS